MTESAVLVFSSGQDSTTILLQLLNSKEVTHIHTISFYYGQKNSSELENGTSIIQELQLEYPNKVITRKVVDVSEITNISADNYLTGGYENIISEGEIPNTFVPGRNILFLTLAAMYGYNMKSKYIYTGVSEADFSNYPDCTSHFMQHMEKTIQIGMAYNFEIVTPFMNKTKTDIWSIANEMGKLDFIKEKTVTCYEGIAGKGCGKCPACKLRAKGLEQFMATKEVAINE